MPNHNLPPTPTQPPAKPREKFKVTIVEAKDAVKTQSRDIAEARLTAEKGKAGFIAKVWKYNLFREYYRQKEMRGAKKQIEEGGNLYIDESEDRALHEEAMGALVERFTSEYDEAIHTEAGEKRETMQDKVNKKKIQDLIKDYATGTRFADDAAFIEEKNRLLAEMKGKKSTVELADNLLEVAQAIRANVAHNGGLVDLDHDLEIIEGEARSGARTEAQYNAVDRITNKILKIPVAGQIINEATVAAGVAIAFSIATRLSQTLASRKVFAYASFGAIAVLSGAIAGAKESWTLEEERRQHARERAVGQGPVDKDKTPRRAEIEASQYEMRSASELIARLNDQFDAGEYPEATATLAEIESRIRISDKNKIDLISYSGKSNVESERLSLDIARAKMKVDLRDYYAANPTQLRADFPQATNFDDLLKSLTSVEENILIKGDADNGVEGVEQKNKLFSKMKRKKVAGAVAKGVITGLVVGATVQQGAAWMKDWISGAPRNFTALEYIFQYMRGNLGTTNLIQNSVPFGAGFLDVKLPSDMQLIPGAGGVYNFMHAGKLVDSFVPNPDGSLPTQAMANLKAAGIDANFSLTQGSGGISKSVKPVDFIQNHLSSFQKIKRALWYDNDTAQFDKNELATHWGGLKGTGVDAKGNYVFDISKMTNTGSSHGSESVMPQAASYHGKLKMLFSLSSGTQSQVVEVPIDAQGHAIIDPNGPAGKLFQIVNGKAVFMGKFAEVAETRGIGADGVERVRILGTHIGKNLFDKGGIPDIVNGTTDQPHLVFSEPGEFDVPPFVPLTWRTPLEPFPKDKKPQEKPVPTPRPRPRLPNPPIELELPGPPRRPELVGPPQRPQHGGPEPKPQLGGPEIPPPVGSLPNINQPIVRYEAPKREAPNRPETFLDKPKFSKEYSYSFDTRENKFNTAVMNEFLIFLRAPNTIASFGAMSTEDQRDYRRLRGSVGAVMAELQIVEKTQPLNKVKRAALYIKMLKYFSRLRNWIINNNHQMQVITNPAYQKLMNGITLKPKPPETKTTAGAPEAPPLRALEDKSMPDSSFEKPETFSWQDKETRLTIDKEKFPQQLKTVLDKWTMSKEDTELREFSEQGDKYEMLMSKIYQVLQLKKLEDEDLKLLCALYQELSNTINEKDHGLLTSKNFGKSFSSVIDQYPDFVKTITISKPVPPPVPTE